MVASVLQKHCFSQNPYKMLHYNKELIYPNSILSPEAISWDRYWDK